MEKSFNFSNAVFCLIAYQRHVLIWMPLCFLFIFFRAGVDEAVLHTSCVFYCLLHINGAFLILFFTVILP